MTRRILAFLFAILLAVIGTAAVLLYVKGADDRAVRSLSPVDVLVAKERVPTGTTGESIRTKGLVETVKLPAGSVPQGEVLSHLPRELDKLVLTSDLQPRQVLLRGMFSQQTRTAGGLAIPEGKLAVSFEATMAEQVAGYVRPGSQVAVFASYYLVNERGGRVLGAEGEGIQGTAVLLPKVEVIAVGPYGEGATTTTPVNGDGEADGEGEQQAAVLVTVAASAEDAAKIIQAAEHDALYLALLNDSSDVGPGVGVDSRTIFG